MYRDGGGREKKGIISLKAQNNAQFSHGVEPPVSDHPKCRA